MYDTQIERTQLARQLALEGIVLLQNDGILPIKVRDRVSLEENVFAILVPEMHRQAVTPYLNSALAPRAHFLESAGLDVWAWSEKAYCLAHALADEAAGAAEGRDMA